MRQLGWRELEHQPGDCDPRNEEAEGGLVAPLEADDDRRQQHETAGPEAHMREQRVIAWRRAMRLLIPDELHCEIAAKRLLEEETVRGDADRDQPREHDQERERQAVDGMH